MPRILSSCKLSSKDSGDAMLIATEIPYTFFLLSSSGEQTLGQFLIVPCIERNLPLCLVIKQASGRVDARTGQNKQQASFCLCCDVSRTPVDQPLLVSLMNSQSNILPLTSKFNVSHVEIFSLAFSLLPIHNQNLFLFLSSTSSFISSCLLLVRHVYALLQYRMSVNLATIS